MSFSTYATRVSNFVAVQPGESRGVLMRLAYSVQAFLIGLILARNMAPDVYGQYSYVLSCLQLACGFAISGMPQLLVREVSAYSQRNQPGLIRGLLIRASEASFGVSLVAAILIGLFFTLLRTGESSQIWFTALMGIPILLMLPLTAVQEAISRGFGFVIAGQLSEFIIRPGVQLALLLLLTAGVLPWNLTPTIAMALFGAAVSVGLISAFLVRRSVTPVSVSQTRPMFQNRIWAGNLGKLALVTWVGVVNSQVGIVFLGALSSDHEVAYFRVAAQLALLIPLGLVVMEALQEPELSRLHTTGDKAGLQRLAFRSCRLSLLAALPLACVYFFLGDSAVMHLFGTEYSVASLSLSVLAIGQIINAAAGSVQTLLIATRRERDVVYALGLALMVNVVVCVLAVPSLGAFGAAIAASASLICWNVVMIIQVVRHVGVVSLPYWPVHLSRNVTVQGNNVRPAAALREVQHYMPESWRHALIVFRRRSHWQRAGIVFVHIPKAAGTSINHALYGRSLGHVSAADIRRYAPSLFAKLPSFAVTRNPWDRLLSAYLFARRTDAGPAGIRDAWRYSSSAFETFERFVEEWLLAQKLDHLDYVFRPQAPFVTDQAGKVLVSFLGRMEEFDEVHEFIEQSLGRSVAIAHLNETSGAKKLRSLYTRKLVNMVGDLYAADVKLFKYDF